VTPEWSNKKCEHQVEYENHQGKWKFLMANTIVGECEVKRRMKNRSELVKASMLFIKTLEAYGENVKG